MQIVSGGATTITKNYPTGAGTHLPQPMKVGTTLSYLATDGLDTVSEAVDSAGTVAAQQLYLPYGGSRYTSGTMPTSKGYTGQRADAATGLDYYNARYYDPVLGQFTSADDILPGIGYDPWGLSRYAYVEGNPISRNDPTGHCPWCIAAVIGAAVGATVGIITAVQNHEDLRTAIVHVAIDTALGAGAGASLALNPAGAGSALAMTAIGIAAFGHNSNGGSFNLDKAFQTAAIGTMAGAVGGALGGKVAAAVGDEAVGLLASSSAGTRIVVQGFGQGLVGAGMDAAGQYASNLAQGQDGITAFKKINPGEVLFNFYLSSIGGTMMQRMVEGGTVGAQAASTVGGLVQGTPYIITAGPSSYDDPSQSSTNGYNASARNGRSYF